MPRDAELPRDLEGEDHTAHRRPDDDVDRRAAPGRPDAIDDQPAQLGDARGPLQHLELLEVAVGMTAALQLEVAPAVGVRLA